MTYYRRRDISSAWDFVLVGVLRLGARFLGGIFVLSVSNTPWPQRWSLIGIVIAGLILMIAARFILRSTFFQTRREARSARTDTELAGAESALSRPARDDEPALRTCPRGWSLFAGQLSHRRLNHAASCR